MRLPHLWKEAFSDIRHWAGDAQSHSLLLDFDGTLTPIVSDPDHALLSDPVHRVLSELRETGRIAIGVISGRALEEVRTLVGIYGIVYAGNHGMEIMGPGIRFIDRAALAVRDATRILALRCQYDLRRLRSVRIRNKGLSITIHWSTPQNPEDQKEIRNVVIDAVADGGGRFTVRDAINSLEILPSTKWNKGAAAQRINTHFGVESCNSIYVGDDQTDEDAFVALKDAITVKVGTADDTSARYALRDSEEVLTLLKLLLVLSRGQ